MPARCAGSQRMPSKNFGSCSATGVWMESSFAGKSRSRTTSSILSASSESWSLRSTGASTATLCLIGYAELLHAEGFHVARYWNNDVLRNPEGVLIDLLDRLAASDPSPNRVR